MHAFLELVNDCKIEQPHGGRDVIACLGGTHKDVNVVFVAMLHADDEQGVEIGEDLDGEVEKSEIQGIGLIWRLEKDSDFIPKDCHLSRDSAWGEDVAANCDWNGKNRI